MIYDLVGIGIGPFNLSLAALLEKTPHIQNIFLDKKTDFDWHPELMFRDSVMQTSYLIDLVTPVDPTSPYSFLNYLCEKHLFYQFLNTERSFISRKEFEQYCIWVSHKLAHKLKFNNDVREISFSNETFYIHTSNARFESKNICVATGVEPRIPDCAKPCIGPNLFYAKSEYLKNTKLDGKSVTIIGGGQTGVEIFRNAIHGKWGNAQSIRLITPRNSLDPFDGSPFTSDYFTPSYLDSFWELSLEKKTKIIASQKLLSDGNTPSYLMDLYNDLYQLKYVENDPRDIRIFACRKLIGVNKVGKGYNLTLENTFYENKEEILSDVVILCTGFQSVMPKILEPLYPRINIDAEGRFNFKKSYAIKWDGPENNRIYALNFSRHNHGIIDPQTSLMAWRSAVVVNDLTQKQIYTTDSRVRNFVEYEGQTRCANDSGVFVRSEIV